MGDTEWIRVHEDPYKELPKNQYLFVTVQVDKVTCVVERYVYWNSTEWSHTIDDVIAYMPMTEKDFSRHTMPEPYDPYDF